MKKKRISLNALFLFVIAGAIGGIFNVLLEGPYPIIRFLGCGYVTLIVYVIMTVIFYELKSGLNTISRVLLNGTTIFSTFAGMALISVSSTKLTPFWWMYLVWLLFATFICWKTNHDAKKIKN